MGIESARFAMARGVGAVWENLKEKMRISASTLVEAAQAGDRLATLHVQKWDSDLRLKPEVGGEIFLLGMRDARGRAGSKRYLEHCLAGSVWQRVQRGRLRTKHYVVLHQEWQKWARPEGGREGRIACWFLLD